MNPSGWRHFGEGSSVASGRISLVINVFLLCLFLVQRRPGIVTWQTPVNMLGLSGILNWFDLPNPSPFGAGLWFFTLLLTFYALYPILRLVSRSRGWLAALACVSLVAFAVLDRCCPMGHALWLTAWSFILAWPCIVSIRACRQRQASFWHAPSPFSWFLSTPHWAFTG